MPKGLSREKRSSLFGNFVSDDENLHFYLDEMVATNLAEPTTSESCPKRMKWYFSPVRNVADRLYKSPDQGSML